MTTSLDKTLTDGQSINLGYEVEGGIGVPTDLEVPSCTIEDIDRSVYSLFKEQIPLYFTLKKKQQRVPVIFATGERFAILTRRKPLRDEAGKIILPLISIQRSGLEQTTTGQGGGQTQPIVIKRRLSEEDPLYQNLINRMGLQNQDNVASPQRTMPAPGQVATRRKNSIDKEMWLQPDADPRHIYEVITLPPTRFFRATYEITFWCDYTQQLNSLLSAVMMSYQNKHGRTFRLETPKGYWFVGQVGESISSGNNFDDFSEDERLVRASITMEVNGYTIEPGSEGLPKGVRQFVSAPQVSFDFYDFPDGLMRPIETGSPTGHPEDLVLQDFDTLDDPLPGQGIAGQPAIARLDVRGDLQQRVPSGRTTSVGGTSAGSDGTQVVVSPSGAKLAVKSRNVRKGESVLRTYGDLTLDDLFS